ncbi:MerR family transcriptional regulator [Hylemonella gracilis ATCC 19624]|uniref:MerR family transcriptional regulator n=1 Tax=Hylemonella gracilis ATCC 19624 TaxID=887062 RepID=F3KQX2_9BURK|nr:MerR family transcriptional regulator [Hylemonella gracilis ATCC 19624]
MESPLPPIPAKRYFTIGEVGELCGVKPHVLRYWEQEFTQLRPMKRRGNRRYYQHHEVLMIRRIRDLLYDQGFTISGARNKMQELLAVEREKKRGADLAFDPAEVDATLDTAESLAEASATAAAWGSADDAQRSAVVVAEAARPAASGMVVSAGLGPVNSSAIPREPFAPMGTAAPAQMRQLRRELIAIRELLSGDW